MSPEPVPPDSSSAPVSPAPSPSRSRRVRRILLATGVLALAACVFWSYRWWNYGRFVESTNNAYLQSDSVVISTRISGFVHQLLVRDNQDVRVGDVLAKIDDQTPRVVLEQANAQAAIARSAIAQVEARIRQQEPELARVKAQLAAAESRALFSTRQLARYQALAESGAEALDAIETVRQTHDQNVCAVEQSQTLVRATELQTATLQTQLEQARAQLRQAEAQAQQAEVDLAATVIVSPIDGRIGNRTTQAGQYAPVGMRLMTIVPVNRTYLVANFKETQLRRMRPGQPAKLRVDAFPSEILTGEVESFSPGTGAQFALIPPNNATGNFTKIVQRVSVRIRITSKPAAGLELLPGLSVDVSVDTSAQPAAAGVSRVTDNRDTALLHRVTR